MHVLKKSIKLLAVLMIAALVLSACSCSMIPGFDKNEINSVKSYEGSSVSSRAYDKADAVKLFSSEALDLYFDKASGGICFTSLYTGKSWTSVPVAENSFASSFVVNVLSGDTVHSLDTSACSASKNGITVEKTENGAVITYKLTSGDITLVMPVVLAVSGAVVEVSCDISSCTVNEGVKILSVQFMPYLGAMRYDASAVDYSVFEDWYLLPDGAGALMFTASEDENKELVFSVYGKDYYEEYIPASVGAYGVKQTGGAFSATVCDGDEISLIRAYRTGADEKNINRVFTEFIITPVSGASGKIKTGKSYSGKIGVSYEFLADSDSDYIDVATSVRQALIRAGLMSPEKCDGAYPLTVSFVASTDGSGKNTTASFGQAENLLSMLKGKGVNEIDMVLLGALGKGLENSASESLSVVSSAGSEKELDELLSYAKKQNLNVYAGANLLTSGSSLRAVSSISGEKKAVVNENPLSPYIGEESYIMKYISPDKIDKGTNRLLSLIEKYDFSGICITDGENSVYENSRSEQGLYTGYDNLLQNNFSAIAASTRLVVSGSSMNVIKYADRLYDVNLDSVTENTGSYITAPFIPAIIHGSLIYSGAAANSGTVSRMELLKAVEYGAAPHYLWVSDERSDKHYDYTVNEAVDFMSEASGKLSGLSSKRITEHFMYESGVYCTGYEGGVRVYVNYNNYSVIIGEISVMPYNFLRIG